MTEQDMKDAGPLAEKLIALLTSNGTRPATAVAAAALGLASIAHLAECGPDAASQLFEHYYKKLGQS